ncbi:hypothetical protein A1O7_06118 [Cladophialophora yegresii CBS 114405]|uniref:Uncharacterized protein n=1 Tax=Cladophialophora yegresii CBS 114405 TaxID=1182544 RepID=W9WJL8_9EURO|nr:uncharacterized protein A1O7_06118 [Cladophialophora yegresii CBS 114405]EXJ58689.1 hypothetical protein A1O7_06118 [Cladophialophora yegresii CBS 114405]
MGCPWMNGGPTASEKFEHFRSRTTIVGAFLFAIRGDIGRMGIRPPLFIGAADHVSLLKDFGVHNQVHSKCPVQTAVVDQFTLAKLYSVKALGQKRNRRYQEGKQTIANWVAVGSHPTVPVSHADRS